MCPLAPGVTQRPLWSMSSSTLWAFTMSSRAQIETTMSKSGGTRLKKVGPIFFTCQYNGTCVTMLHFSGLYGLLVHAAFINILDLENSRQSHSCRTLVHTTQSYSVLPSCYNYSFFKLDHFYFNVLSRRV